MLLAEITNQIQNIDWYAISKDLLIPLLSPFIATFGALWVGAKLGYLNKSLTIQSNKDIKEQGRIEELEQMATVQQIKEIVQESEGRTALLFKTQIDSLKDDMKLQGDGLGQRIDTLSQNIDSVREGVTKANANIVIIINAMNQDPKRKTPLNMIS